MTEKLKPCPFCGHTPIEWSQTGLIKCLYSGCSSNPEAYSLHGWNARADGWVSVDDRLPEIGALVFVCTSVFGNVVDIDNICDHGGWLRSAYLHDKTKSKVTHWMPLPIPPKAASCGE